MLFTSKWTSNVIAPHDRLPCENLTAAYISAAYKVAVALIIFMLVILFKPQGLLGKQVERKV